MVRANLIRTSLLLILVSLSFTWASALTVKEVAKTIEQSAAKLATVTGKFEVTRTYFYDPKWSPAGQSMEFGRIGRFSWAQVSGEWLWRRHLTEKQLKMRGERDNVFRVSGGKQMVYDYLPTWSGVGEIDRVGEPLSPALGRNEGASPISKIIITLVNATCRSRSDGNIEVRGIGLYGARLTFVFDPRKGWLAIDYSHESPPGDWTAVSGWHIDTAEQIGASWFPTSASCFSKNRGKLIMSHRLKWMGTVTAKPSVKDLFPLPRDGTFISSRDDGEVFRADPKGTLVHYYLQGETKSRRGFGQKLSLIGFGALTAIGLVFVYSERARKAHERSMSK